MLVLFTRTVHVITQLHLSQKYLSLQTASPKPESASACLACCGQHWLGCRVHSEAGGPNPGLITDVIKRTCIPFTMSTESAERVDQKEKLTSIFSLHAKTLIHILRFFMMRTAKPPCPLSAENLSLSETSPRPPSLLAGITSVAGLTAAARRWHDFLGEAVSRSYV